jgi:hypothetical protein
MLIVIGKCKKEGKKIRAFTTASLKGVCSLSFRKNFKKVTKSPLQQLR